jgi:hypothetical protein
VQIGALAPEFENVEPGFVARQGKFDAPAIIAVAEGAADLIAVRPGAIVRRRFSGDEERAEIAGPPALIVRLPFPL